MVITRIIYIICVCMGKNSYKQNYNWVSLGLFATEIIGVISMNLTYKPILGPTLYVRGDHQSRLVTAYNSNVKRMASQSLTKYLQLTQQVISTYRWQCSCKRNWHPMTPVGYVNGLSRLVGVLHLRLCPLKHLGTFSHFKVIYAYIYIYIQSYTLHI